MKRQIILLLLIIGSVLQVNSQSFIGAHKLIIKKDMKEHHSNFFFSKEVVGGKQSFIKFEDFDGYKTWLFVLDDDGYCEYSVLMCDYSFLKNVVDSLNNNFEYKNDMKWIDYFSGKKNNLITVKKKDWYFSVITRPLEKDDLKNIK